MSRVKPHSITSPAQEVFKKIRKAAIWVVVGLVLLVPMLFVYNWATAPGTWHFPWNTANGGGNTATALPSQRVTIGSTPVDLTSGGQYSITWHLSPGKCVDIYDSSMQWLAEDCAGQFTDLRGRTPTYFASSRGDQVVITYNVW